MSRRLRISAPPPSRGPDALWFQQVTDALNVLPNFSIISTSAGPNSNTTGDPSNIAFDVGSSVTKLWLKVSGTTTTGWSALSWI